MLEFLIIAFSSALQFPGCYSLISSYIYRSDKPPENSIFFSPATIKVLSSVSWLKTDSFKKAYSY